MKKIVDGNKACAMASYLFSEMSFIYPITPSSTMASEVDKMSSDKCKNLFNDTVKVVEMQSEAGAAGAMHGALLSGSLASTFTASQGLLLMIPNMYKMAGEMLPGVIHVAARTVATHALSIFGDHSDIYATRQTGFSLIASTNVEDAYNLAIVSHLASIKGRIPVLHFFDGFRTSHEIRKINIPNTEDILGLIPYEDINKFRSEMLNVGAGIQKGMAENEDIYFQSVEARNSSYDKFGDTVNYYMSEINKITGKDYKPFNYYGDSTAEHIIIAMGSVSDTVKLVIEELNRNQSTKVGLIEVHLYRPFSTKYLFNVLPNSVKRIAVLDRTKEIGSNGEPLYLDIVNALKETDIKVVGGRYGLSSKNTTPADIKSVYDMLNGELKNNFTIGIEDDITNLSLPKSDFKLDLGAEEIKIYGFGSDGMVSASKDLLSIVGDNLDYYVDGYFEYDSKKSGGVTVSNLRINKYDVKAPYYVSNPQIVVVTREEYLHKFDCLSEIKENGSFILSSTKSTLEINNYLPNKVKQIIKERNIKFYLINAEEIAKRNGINGKISKIMEAVILKLLNIPNFEKLLEDNIIKSFKTKGEDVVNSNINAVKETLSNLQEVVIDTIEILETSVKEKNIFEKILAREGNSLKVSELEPFKNGTFPCGLTKCEKRAIGGSIAKWIPENCIQCGQCAAVCPHAVIRPFILEDTDKGLPLLGDTTGKNKYYISISEKDCTSCNLCYKVCPGKSGQKAIGFGSYSEELQNEAIDLFENHENPKLFPKYTIKGSQFEKPKFEFSGACAGCGETPYIKMLTQLFGDELIIANATGCSSIYGGSAPSTPYSIPWANSLFEDNAEFGYGIYKASKNIRSRIEHVMKESIDSVTEDVKKEFNDWMSNKDNFELTLRVKENLKSKEIPKELKDLIDYMPSRSIWAVGGDGWAYDIGFGGIDHVLSSGENINILVLDSEVYSNTGGQSSKASRTGQVAEFADLGKLTNKKDLFRIAMSYPNCYVASVCMGANIMQTINAFKEAYNHNGPSIIIAYSTCVEHGIKNGMSNSLETQKNIIEAGYSLLMRYNPSEEKLYLDSKEPNFDLYENVLLNEVRYSALKIKNEDLAKELLEINKQNAIKKYNFYKKISEN